jgi:hypothetical protein
MKIWKPLKKIIARKAKKDVDRSYENSWNFSHLKNKIGGNLKNNNNIFFLDASNFESNCDEWLERSNAM